MEDVTHHFGQKLALNGFSLTICAGEVVCLVGPSGCGKSTTLHIAAGLEKLQEGAVSIDGITVAGRGHFLPPEARNLGMVFQDYALFPHLNVLDNVTFGIRAKGAAERRRRAEIILDKVEMTRYAAKFPHELSGGEQQRVALARALAPRPAMMLMDEPFSGLDTQLRDSVRSDTLNILAETSTPMLLVTHDPDEAMGMSDRVAVMRDGYLVQVAPPAEIFRAPADLFTARVFGKVNAFSGMAAGGFVDTPLGRLTSTSPDLIGPVTVGVRNEAVFLSDTGISATVIGTRVLGHYSAVELALNNEIALTAHIPGTVLATRGKQVKVDFDRAQAFVFAKE